MRQEWSKCFIYRSLCNAHISERTWGGPDHRSIWLPKNLSVLCLQKDSGMKRKCYYPNFTGNRGDTSNTSAPSSCPCMHKPWLWMSNLVLASAASVVAHQPLSSLPSPDGWHCAWRFRLWALWEAYYMVTNPTLIKILGNYFSMNVRIIIKKS